ncbi:tetratricopeptide repeat protein [Tautonia marina]|uniref:tetratricopeptide repeat protein n=1 Tax=Tautonia marina TaxID=2653855 RepID=UPI001260F810|nr:tetratricopeptide repeat protein [Tautonia marina]
MIGSHCVHALIVVLMGFSLPPGIQEGDETSVGIEAVGGGQSHPLIDQPDLFIPRSPRTAEDIERFDTLRLYAAGRALEARREWTDAVELLEKARQLEPDSVAILRRLSRLYFGLGGEDRIQKGLETGLAALEAEPEDAETIRRLVRHYRTSNNDEAAEQLLRSVLENPELPDFCQARLVVLHELGRLYADAQRFDQAVEPFAQLVQLLDAREATRLTPAQVQDVFGEVEADAYRRFGETFFNAGRFDLAIVALRRSLVYDPDSQQTPLYLAQALLRANRPEEALSLLEPIVKDRPPGRVTFDVLIQVLTVLNRTDEIIPRLEQASKVDPSNFLLRYALAERYEAEGRRDEAQRLYQNLISDQPDPEGLATLAQSLREQGKLEELILLFETASTQRSGRLAIETQLRLIGTDPELAGEILDAGIALLNEDPPRLGKVGIELLSEIASRSDQLDQRVELDRLSLEQDPSPQNHLELADSLVAAGQPGEAVETFEQLLKRYPELQEQPQLLARMAELQFDAGQIEEALESGRKILDRQPNDLPMIQLVGYALQRLKRFEEALDLYQGIPERFAGNPEAIRLSKIWTANALASADRFEEGERILLQLLEEQPDDPWLNNDLGYLWAERGINLDRAEELIRKAVDADPSNSAYLDSLGWVLYKLGRPEDALTHLEEAVRLRASAVNLDHLGDVYFVLDRRNEARDAWKRAESLAEDADPPDPTLESIREKLQALGDDDPPPPSDANTDTINP